MSFDHGAMTVLTSDEHGDGILEGADVVHQHSQSLLHLCILFLQLQNLFITFVFGPNFLGGLKPDASRDVLTLTG